MTRSEEVFERFLILNGILFEKIEEVTSPKLDSAASVSNRRPDYCVKIGDGKLFFEVKQLEKISGGAIGSSIRGMIEKSKGQIQFGAKQGVPSILLIYNMLDPVFQLSGTDFLDFDTGMYGQKTILIDKNTPFSAIGRLADRVGEPSLKPTVRLFENIYAKVKIPYDQLPPCFEVVRAQLSKGDPFSEF